jgi:glucose-1-phosphate cytidylyltransferase
MIEIGGKPILWHILKLYSHFGVNDFIICLGYKGYVIKEYFANYFLHMSDVTFDLKRNEMRVHERHAEPWTVTLVDTGEATLTGGRLLRVRHYLGDGPFCMTYGDGLADVPIDQLIRFHQQEKRIATVTAIQPPGRYGALRLEGGQVAQFQEKPVGDGGWINGGFFVLEPSALDYIAGDLTAFESTPLEMLSSDQQLSAFTHRGFWQAMDTLRDKMQLEEYWSTGKAPWKLWA